MTSPSVLPHTRHGGTAIRSEPRRSGRGVDGCGDTNDDRHWSFVDFTDESSHVSSGAAPDHTSCGLTFAVCSLTLAIPSPHPTVGGRAMDEKSLFLSFWEKEGP